jgi:predicted small secreted protein
MFLRAVLLSILCLLLAACASTMTKDPVGKDVRHVQFDRGEPVHVYDMPDGRRAFQYYASGAVSRPDSKESSDSTVIYSESRLTLRHGAVPSSGCLITYVTEWNAAAGGWIVRDVKYPQKLVC